MAKQTVTFHSNFTEHELVRVPRNETPTAGLAWVQTTNAVKYKFQPAVDENGELVGRLDVIVGTDKLVDGSGWLRAGEEQGVERDAVAALRAHREFGPGRDFWQMATPMAMVRSRIRSAIANLREQELADLLAEERAEGKRAVLVSEIEDGLALVREQIANIEAAKAQADEEPPAAAAKPKAKPKAPAGVA